MSTAYTTSASAFVISLLFATTLVVVRREYRLSGHVVMWAISFVLLAASHACRLTVLEAPASGAAAAYLARIAMINSAVLLACGFLSRIGRRVHGTIGIGVVAVLVLVGCWLHQSGPALALGRFLTAVTVIAMIVIIFRSMRGKGGTTFIVRAVAILYGIYMLLLAMSAWFVWLDGGITDAVFTGLTLVGMPVVTVCTGVLVLLVLVSDLAAALHGQTLLDPMTKVLNRRGLEERMHAMKAAPASSIAIVAVDLDKFKAINDQLGHAGGDRVLVAFADHLKDTAGDFQIARVGGEEFLLFASHMSVDDAAGRAEAICRGVTLSVMRAHGITGVTASFGVAAGTCAEPWQDVAERADQALYRAKRDGRNRVEIFSDADDVRKRA